MTDLSLSERAHAAIECRLRGIRKANGYRTDAGLRVFNSRKSLSSDDLPCFVVWETQELPASGTASGSHRSMAVALTLTIEGHVECDTEETGAQLQLMKADAKKALMQESGALSDACGKFAAVDYIRAQAAPRQNGDQSEAVSIDIDIRYQEAYGDPYASR